VGIAEATRWGEFRGKKVGTKLPRPGNVLVLAERPKSTEGEGASGTSKTDTPERRSKQNSCGGGSGTKLTCKKKVRNQASANEMGQRKNHAMAREIKGSNGAGNLFLVCPIEVWGSHAREISFSATEERKENSMRGLSHHPNGRRLNPVNACHASPILALTLRKSEMQQGVVAPCQPKEENILSEGSRQASQGKTEGEVGGEVLTEH